MPNPFFSLIHKFFNKTAPKPINSPFSLGQIVLNELADCKRQLAELQKPREVVTHYERDHEAIGQIQEDLRLLSEAALLHPRTVEALYSRISATEHDLIKRIEHLENNHIQALTRRISSANWQRPRRKDGRWTKKGGGNASV